MREYEELSLLGTLTAISQQVQQVMDTDDIDGKEIALANLQNSIDEVIKNLELRLPFRMILDEDGYLTFHYGAQTVFNSHNGDSELDERTGQKCWVLYPLSPKDYDRFDVGRMYRIRFVDGFETDAFEDELLPELCANPNQEKQD